MPPSFIATRPEPTDEHMAETWRHVGMRLDILTGPWQQHADDRMADFFDGSVRQFLPPAEISHNPALTIVSQVASLYDEAGVVEADGIDDDAIELLSPPEMWAQMQEVLELVVGLNDCYLFSGYDPERGLFHKIVPFNAAEFKPNPSQPDQPIAVRHLEASVRPGTGEMEWTWTTYDLSDEKSPVYKVEAVDSEGELVDVTEAYSPGLNGRYLYVDKAGAPIWTWTAYHRRVGNRIARPWRGAELFEGTKTAAVLKTYWLAGVRDGAHPQRYGVDVDIDMAGATDKSGGGAGSRVVRMNQLGVLMFRSRAERSGTLSQFAPAMDPKSTGEAIAAFSAELAIYCGVAPQDVQVSGGTGGMSGYAIKLSREGQRKMRQKLEVPMKLGDQQRLAACAALLNAYTTGGPEYPTDPAAYRIRYADLKPSLEEIRAALEEATTLLEAGAIGRVDFFLRFNPGMTREQALEAIVRNRLEDATIERLVAAATQNTPPQDADLPGATP